MGIRGSAYRLTLPLMKSSALMSDILDGYFYTVVVVEWDVAVLFFSNMAHSQAVNDEDVT